MFLSYATVDRPHALEVRELLGERHTVFMDASSLAGGAQWLREIEAALVGCRVVVVLCSAAAWEPKRWVRNELLLARQHDKPVIPVLLEGTLPLELVDRQFVDGRVAIAEYGVDLLAAVATHLAPAAMDEAVDRLLGGVVRAQLARDGAAAAARYREAASLDAALPRTVAELWAQVASAPEAVVVGLGDILFVERSESVASLYEDGRSTYRWSIHIEAAPQVLERISHVRYDLTSYYTSGLRIVRSRETGFELSQFAWGPLAFPVGIVLDDGHTLKTWADVVMRDQRTPAPAEPFPLGG